MRQFRLYGSVRGAMGNHCPYRDVRHSCNSCTERKSGRKAVASLNRIRNEAPSRTSGRERRNYHTIALSCVDAAAGPFPMRELRL